MPDAAEDFALTEKDLKVLSLVHPTLEKIVKRAAQETEFPFMVFEGVRTMSRQRKLVKTGASKTYKSRHLTGHAVDLVPLIGGKPVWDVSATMVIAAAMFKAADDLGFSGKMRWGGDWDMDGNYYNSRFYDGPHFELLSSIYPASKPAKRTADYLASRGNATPPSQTRQTVSKYSGKHKTAFSASVQQALNHMGIQVSGKHITVDGYYGDVTRRGVAEAQKMLGFKPANMDGLWGPDTGVAYREWAAKQEAEDRGREKAKAEMRAREQANAPAAPVDKQGGLTSGVVSDDKLTRPVATRAETIDREAVREEERDATPTPPAYKDMTPESQSSGGGNSAILVVVAIAAAVALAAVLFA